MGRLTAGPGPPHHRVKGPTAVTSTTPWTWAYEGYDPAAQRLRESLCTLGNGYFATRGALPECTADEVHYPGTYVAGCYNRLTSTVAGRQVENEDMVNLPNWLPLRFRPAGGDWLTPDGTPVLEHHQTLHLEAGLLERRTRYRLGEHDTLHVRQLRLVHMADPHLAALRTEFTLESGTADLEVEAALDGGVTNSGVPRYRDLNGRHLTHVHTGTDAPDTVWLRCRTTTSDIRIGLASRLTADAPVVCAHDHLRAGQRVRLALSPGHTAVVDKTVALHTSRDQAISDPLQAALDRVGSAPRFDELLRSHRTAWGQLWRRAQLEVPGEAGSILRLHLFHVLQTLSPHTADLDVGVPARGLHGEAYRGHVFWDELFVLPYLNLHFPRSPGRCSTTATGAWNGPPRRPARSAGAAPCTRGRAAATAARRPSSSISTRARALAARPQPPPAARRLRRGVQRVAVLRGQR